MSTNWTTESIKTDFVVGDQIKNADKHTKEEVVGEISTDMYGDDMVVGINDSKLTATLNKLTMIDSKTNKLFDDLTENVEDTSYFKCSASDSLNKLLDDISINIPTVKNNITSYIKDLELVKKDFGVISYTKAVMFQKAGSKIPEINEYIEKEK